MKNLWNSKIARSFSKNDLDMRVYSSRLLGQDSELVLHGGGNTSVKGKYKNIFGEYVETLFIKGSGWDLISIEKEGFAPVDLNYLIKLSKFNKLTDSQMVVEQKLATLDPVAPTPSIEAILHALIPYKFVDHTHADSVLSITNTPSGRKKINEIYDKNVLIVPYVMPGFILAKKIAEMTKDIDWKKLNGMILLNHGVFSFGMSAKESYDGMIKLVNKAENYLSKSNVWRKYKKSRSKLDLSELAKIRLKASEMTGKASIAILNDTTEAVGFSKLNNSKALSARGTLTPDHVIRTKPFAWVVKDDLNLSAKDFINKYNKYFQKNATKGIRKLDNGPKWALWPKHGTVCFGTSIKDARVVYDINKHTVRAMQTSDNLEHWKPISFKDLFNIEYWELEQAKLKKDTKPLDFEGKIALVTGAAAGIGYACVQKLLDNGCCVVGIDKNPKIKKLFHNLDGFKGVFCDLTNEKDISKAVSLCVKEFGGLDILVSNAGVFSSSARLEDIENKKWKSDININLTSHHRILRQCIPYLKLGINPAVIFMGSRNVGAPGPGAGTYTIAKSGLTQMSRLAAIELSQYNIRVNVVHPDCVYDTDVWTDKILKARAKQYGISVDKYKHRNLLKTSVSSKDVAELVVFLASLRSSKTTGAQIPIDGGNDRII
ncbi:MAG: bifunctional aldolase/short-chain dehydrogenase [Candidatus Marinimicrobia bacterium]|nr:bifunctional aldolase/short-chain dehydrogenase [Candidatus Neomarinimicrobiota bacterium]|tara:strand:- start:4851 stop:6824 length:1974 start_codon:yes stop_codon:yes gene_type:complete